MTDTLENLRSEVEALTAQRRAQPVEFASQLEQARAAKERARIERRLEEALHSYKVARWNLVIAGNSLTAKAS